MAEVGVAVGLSRAGSGGRGTGGWAIFLAVAALAAAAAAAANPLTRWWASAAAVSVGFFGEAAALVRETGRLTPEGGRRAVAPRGRLDRIGSLVSMAASGLAESRREVVELLLDGGSALMGVRRGLPPWRLRDEVRASIPPELVHPAGPRGEEYLELLREVVGRLISGG